MVSGIRDLTRRASIRWGMLFTPLLAFVALSTWALSSPVGASPDDDYHLVSIWCADGPSETCRPGQTAATRVVPAALVQAPCFAFDPARSAGCQSDIDWTAGPTVETARGNFSGGYPPVYYATMNLLVGPDIEVSALSMRLANVALFVGMGTALYCLLVPRRRSTLLWTWAITTVPLGLFTLASNNPSSWTIMGVGYGWLALLGYYESSGWRRAALGTLFAVSALLASGSRGDGAVYLILATVAVMFLVARRSSSFILDSILPVVVAVGSALMFRFSRPVEIATVGLGTSGLTGEETTAPGLLGRAAYNLIQVPSLWTGVFGQYWGLGWLDTSMPAIVWLGALLCFLLVGASAARGAGPRKVLVLVGGGVVLLALPTVMLVAAGELVGENMQPRYLLPLIVLFAGMMLLPSGAREPRLGRLQTVLVVATLSVAHLVALYLNVRRYTTGFDVTTPSLGAGVEWWWGWAPSPNVVWILGSVAFSALLVVMLRTPAAFAARAARAAPAERRGIALGDA